MATQVETVGGLVVYVRQGARPVTESVCCTDLARALIRLSGLEECVDVDIAFSGVRLGEKLYEEVFFGHEAVEPTVHPKVLRINPKIRHSGESSGEVSLRSWSEFCA